MIPVIARLEFQQAIRQPVFWMLSVAYLLFAMAYISTDVVGQVLSSAVVDVNSSWAITRMITHLSYIGLVGSAAFVGHSVIRDFRGGMAELLFSTSLTRRDYVAGRLLGSTLAAALAFSAMFVGLILGHLVPWADTDRLADFPILGILLTYLVFALPNVIIGACVLFTLALVTRDLLKTWIGAVGILLGFFASRAFAGVFYATAEGQQLAALVEPFGTYAAISVALEWTVHERNNLVLGYQWLILGNRFLWLVLAGLAVYLAYRFFLGQPIQTAPSRRAKARGRGQFMAGAVSELSVAFCRRLIAGIRLLGRATVAAFCRARANTNVRMTLAVGRFELRRILRGAPLRIMLGLGLAVLWIWMSQYGRAYGTGFYPYTADMVDHIDSVLRLPLLALITFYAAELVWGASLLRFSPIVDATPAPSRVMVAAKFLALAGSMLVYLIAAALIAIVYQWSRGFTSIDLSIYAIYLGLYLFPYLAIMAAFALLFQVLAGNRYIGMIAMALLVLGTEFAAGLDIHNNLLIPGAQVALHHTPLAGFGHYLESAVWFRAYWLAVAAVALCLAAALYPRGESPPLTGRLQALFRDLRSGRCHGLPIALVVAAGIGGWVFWNTQAMDPRPDWAEPDTIAAFYEKTYGDYRDARRPRLTGVSGELSLHPDTRHFRFSGELTLENPWDQPLEQLMLTAPADTRLLQAQYVSGPTRESQRDEALGVIIFSDRLMPGERTTIRVAIESNPITHFENRPGRTPVISNGSLLFQNQFLPTPGYERGREISDASRREEFQLPERLSSHRERDDPSGQREPLGMPHGGWLELELMVTLPEGQTAIAPGRLIASSRKNGKNAYHFQTEAPIPPEFAVVAGSYRTFMRQVQGRSGPVNLSVHAMPGHSRNAENLLDTMERTLVTLESALGPYPHPNMRIVEADFGHPNCRIRADAILCDSSLGFINDPALDQPRNPSNSLVKIPSAMLANLYLRSVLLPANLPGGSSLTDGPAFYLSQLVWESEAKGNEIVDTIADLHWHYLTQRTEAEEEGTIVNHPEQTWLGAHKHAAVLYGLERYAGRDEVLSAIASVVDKYRLKSPPYPHASVLADALRGYAPDWKTLIDDGYERRTLYSLAMESVSVERLQEDSYWIQALAQVNKFYIQTDGSAQTTELEIPVEMAVYGEPDESGEQPVLWEGLVTASELKQGNIGITVNKKPKSVAIDPNRRLIDPDRTDNRLGF